MAENAVNPLPVFTESQQQMAQLIAQAVMAALQANNSTSVPAEDKMRDSEIGYFQPDLHKSYGSDDPVTVGSDAYFRDVYAFEATPMID